jgi:hypothetical protein
MLRPLFLLGLIAVLAHLPTRSYGVGSLRHIVAKTLSPRDAVVTSTVDVDGMAVTDRKGCTPTADIVVVGMSDVTLLLVSGEQSSENRELVQDLESSVVDGGEGASVEVIWSA